MPADPLDIVASTADAAFGTDEEGRIVIWNKAAERLLGYGAAGILGRPCHDVLCGRDAFGNRFCDELCAIEMMASRREPIRHFELSVRKASGQFQRVGVSVMVVPGPKAAQYTVLHLLQPLAEGEVVAHGPAAPAAFGGLPAAAASAPPPQSRSLTAREIEILRLLADGAGTEAIADTLFISVTTVRNHIQNILRKLEVHSKLEAVSLALRHRLI